jgi:hypothetical protein
MTPCDPGKPDLPMALSRWARVGESARAGGASDVEHADTASAAAAITRRFLMSRGGRTWTTSTAA